METTNGAHEWEPSHGYHEWGPQMEATNGATKVDHEWGPRMEARNVQP